MSSGHKVSTVRWNSQTPWSPAGACQHAIMGQEGVYRATPLPEELLAVMDAVRGVIFFSLVKSLVIRAPVDKLPLTNMQITAIKPSRTSKKLMKV